MCWISHLVKVNSKASIEVFQSKDGKNILAKLINSVDSTEVFIAYTIIGSITFQSIDLGQIAELLKPEVLRFQIQCVNCDAFQRISWTLCNILADDHYGEGLFQDLVKSKSIIQDLLGTMTHHIRSGKEPDIDLLTSILTMANGPFVLHLLDDYNVLSVVEAYLERPDRGFNLMRGLRLLQALFEKSKLEFVSRKLEEDPVVNKVIYNSYLLDLLEKINKCPLKSVYDLWTELSAEYLPVFN